MEHIFTFRGHQVGVTAINHIQTCLISGDEEGSIILWDIETLKSINIYRKIVPSRIQSIRIVETGAKGAVIVQSRDHGLFIYEIQSSIDHEKISIILRDQLSSYPGIFSKGDASIHPSIGIVLSYASVQSSQIVSVKNLDDDWQTLSTIDLERPVGGGNVFDIRLGTNGPNPGNLTCYAGYEDGKIALYTLRLNNSTKLLEIASTRIINMKINDFVSAFDIHDGCDIIIGSPTRHLILYNCDTGDEVKLKLDRQGVSAIRCFSGHDWFAVARWDSQVDIYCFSSKHVQHTIKSHNKQVQDILWLSDISCFPNYNKILCCVSLDGTISLRGT